MSVDTYLITKSLHFVMVQLYHTENVFNALIMIHFVFLSEDLVTVKGLLQCIHNFGIGERVL